MYTGRGIYYWTDDLECMRIYYECLKIEGNEAIVACGLTTVGTYLLEILNNCYILLLNYEH